MYRSYYSTIPKYVLKAHGLRCFGESLHLATPLLVWSFSGDSNIALADPTLLTSEHHQLMHSSYVRSDSPDKTSISWSIVIRLPFLCAVFEYWAVCIGIGIGVANVGRARFRAVNVDVRHFFGIPLCWVVWVGKGEKPGEAEEREWALMCLVPAGDERVGVVWDSGVEVSILTTSLCFSSS